MRNIFTHTSVPPLFRDLSYNTQVTMTPMDVPYYAIRALQEVSSEQVFSPNVFLDPFKEINVESLAVVDSSDALVLAEIHFLDSLGLVTNRGTLFYIISSAAHFYAEDGLFASFRPEEDTYEERKEKLIPTMALFTSYILPGRYWRAFYARTLLPSSLESARRLDQEMQEVRSEYNAIRLEFASP
jgi:hypothetical protein